MANALSLVNVPKLGRIPRRPLHRFRVDHKPWEITPFLLAPVIPGETMKNLMLQSRVVTDTLVSPLVGWWIEYFFFYVKHRQMPNAANHTAMVLDPATTLASGAVNARHYYDGRGYNWVAQCIEPVVREWFRDEGETWNANTIRTGVPAARIGVDGIHESLVDTTVLPTGGTLGADQEQNDRLNDLYEYLRAMRFTQMTYEDWLRTYGVQTSQDKREKPELIRYVKEWTYPTNTVEPTTGIPTTACSWAVTEKADKDRFFDEPGFVFGVSIARPKVYLGNQTGNASVALDNVLAWLPALMRDDPSTSLREFTNTAGPFGKTTGGFTNGYWVDIRDLYVYGDQFVDAATQTNAIALPTVAQVHKYGTEAIADALFSGAGKFVKQDGVVQLSILGTQMDMT